MSHENENNIEPQNIFEHSKSVKAKHFTFFDVCDLPEEHNCMLANLDAEQSRILHEALVKFAKNAKNSKKHRVRAAKMVEAIEHNQFDRFEGKSNPIIPTTQRVFK